jgi:hypothetical protein
LVGKDVVKSIVDELVALIVGDGVITREPDTAILLIIIVSNLFERELI